MFVSLGSCTTCRVLSCRFSGLYSKMTQICLRISATLYPFPATARLCCMNVALACLCTVPTRRFIPFVKQGLP